MSGNLPNEPLLPEMYGGALCEGDDEVLASGDGGSSFPQMGAGFRGPDGVADQPPIAGMLKGNNQRILDRLEGRFEAIPWETCTREGDLLWPDDLQVSFLGKDLTKRLRQRWSNFRMGEEGLTLRDRFRRSLGVYDWVIARKPRMILVWTDEYPELRAAVMAGNDLGIPTVELVHGGFRGYQHGDPHASGWAKWKLGSWQYREWHKANKLPGEVIVTGITHIDPWQRTNMSLARDVGRHGLRIPAGAPCVLFLEDAPFERTPWGMREYSEDIRDQILWAYKQAEAIVENLHLIVNLHPLDRDTTPQGYQEVLKRFGITSNYTIVDENLPMCIAAADISVGAKASSIIEGLHVGLPGLIVETRPFFNPSEWLGRGMEVAVGANEVLHKLVLILTNSMKMGQLIRETEKGARYFGTDGMATDRATRAIDMILEGRSPDEGCWMEVPS
jgi:hypothetical protein